MGSIPTWKETAQLRRQQQSAAIPPAWRLKSIPADFRDSRHVIDLSGILTPKELDITSTVGVAKILRKYEEGDWSVEDVVTAYCKRAAIAHQLIKCCTEFLFGEAIDQARQIDRWYADTGEFVGPLHGIPISLKDNHDVKGVDSTVGWVGLIGKPAQEDSLAVQQYRALGAIVYVKTNVPQSLMMSDSYNHVFGQSLNSLSRALISGGSSGGEGALIGARGSILGIGTDIGGSIRIPAALQGLYGLSPTVGRVPNRESGKDQKYIVRPVAGPMANSLSSIELFMEAFSTLEPWMVDPTIQPFPWNYELARLPKGRLRIGYLIDDGVVAPHPPIQRAMHDVVRKLRQCGHEVVEWDASEHKAAYYDLWVPAVTADGGKRCQDLCDLIGEPLIEGMLVGTAETLLSSEQKMALSDEIWEFKRQYLAKWKDANIDALIMPVMPWVGMRPKAWVKSQQYVGYSAIWNLVDYTALTVPVGIVDSMVDDPGRDEAWTEYGKSQTRGFSDEFNHAMYQDLWNHGAIQNLPVNLQIVTGRFGEERAIAVAKILESLP